MASVARLVIIAVAIGFIEAVWTRPGAGGPASTWMGVFAILAIFVALVTWKLWLIPGLAILEEGTHLVLTHLYMIPSQPLTGDIITRVVFSHWSAAFLGFNYYPWILFPLITLIGVLLYRFLTRREERFKKWLDSPSGVEVR